MVKHQSYIRYHCTVHGERAGSSAQARIKARALAATAQGSSSSAQPPCTSAPRTTGTMMRVRGPLALAVATFLVICTADTHQEQDIRVGEQSGDRYMPTGHKPRNLDPLGGGNLVREIREPRRPYYMGRRYEYGSAYGGKRDPWLFASPIDYGYYGDVPKRNFDEIDRSNLDNFVKKRNFDEIDQTSMPFPFKRFYHLFGSNYLDTPVSSFDKKRYRPDYPMDEIDLSQFPIGSKRSEYSASHPLR